MREVCMCIQKNSFTEVSKNLDTNWKIILLGQNNYVQHSNWLLECPNFL